MQVNDHRSTMQGAGARRQTHLLAFTLDRQVHACLGFEFEFRGGWDGVKTRNLDTFYGDAQASVVELLVKRIFSYVPVPTPKITSIIRS